MGRRERRVRSSSTCGTTGKEARRTRCSFTCGDVKGAVLIEETQKSGRVTCRFASDANEVTVRKESGPSVL